MLNSDELIKEIRFLIRLWHVGDITDIEMGMCLSLMDILDHHLINGGSLPQSWGEV
jgi:hypothetical protein